VTSSNATARRSRSAGNTPPATFESAYQELREVIGRLEGGGLGLDEAVQLFERGRALVGVCEQAVANAELRVTRLSPESAELLSDVAHEA
jgi:exodeoxyribonuclease VII small subunit